MRIPLRLFAAVLATACFLAANSASAGPYDTAVLSDNPLNYWRLGDGTTTIVDSVSANNGTAEAAVLLGQTSLVYSNPANAAIRTASGSRVAVPGYEKFPLGATGYTAEYWLQINANTAAFRNILGDGEGAGDFYMMNYLTNSGPKIRPHFAPNNAPVSLDSPANLNVGEIYHVVTTWDRATGQANIYLNGVLNGSTITTTNAPANSNNQMFIGRDNREPGGDFTIDDASFYTRALTAAQVRNHRVMGYVGAPVPNSLVHYWNMDESPSGTGNASNLFGVANTGVFAGAATRNAGIIGEGAARFTGSGAQGLNVGTANFSFTTGLTVEALFSTTGLNGGLQEIFRKEDGGNRILLSFQDPANINNNFGQFVGGTDDNLPGISFGLNIGGSYGEMDVELDGQGGRPTLAQLNNGQLHHIVATYDSATGIKAMYLDGDLLGMVNLAPGGLIASGGGAAAFIGSSGGTSEFFNGLIDEVAIYDRALSLNEVQAHFRNVQAGLNFFAEVPEPASLWIWGSLGLLGLTTCIFRRRGARR